MLQCSCEQIYFQAFLFQKCIAEIFNRQDSTFYIQLASSFHMKCTVCRNNILLGELQFFSLQSIAPRLHSVYILLDYRQSTCTQATCSLHPLESTTQPTHKNLFFLENMQILQEEARATFCSNQDKNSTSRSLNATGI